MNVFDLAAKISLDTSAYESGLSKVEAGIGKAAQAVMRGVAIATTAITGFVGASVKVGSEFDKAMSQVQATMLKTTDEMANDVGSVDTAYGHFEGNLREFAQFLGKNTAFSATQAAEALNYMALAGYNTQESLEALPNVLSLAAAGGFDLARASDMVTDVQTAFGLVLENNEPDFERTNQLVDEMAKVASISNTSVEQLGDAFLTVGGLAKEMNGGFIQMADGSMRAVDGVQELEIMLGAMANAGVKGSEAGIHMRNMLLKLASPTSDGTKRLNALGVAVFNAEGEMRSMRDIMGDLSGALGTLTQEEKIQAISDLFNTRDMASAEALLAAVGSDWDEIGRGILKAEGAAADMAKIQLDNLSGDVTLFKSAFEGLQIAISDGVTPTLREFVQFGTEAISTLTTAFQDGGLNGAMDALGTILTDGLSMIVSKLPTFVDAGMQLLGALARGVVENAPMFVNTIYSMIYDFAEQFVNDGSLGSSLQQASNQRILGDIIQGIVNGIPLLLNSAERIINGIVEGITAYAPMVLQGGLEILLNLATGIAKKLPTLIPTIVSLVRFLVDQLTDRNNLQAIMDAAAMLLSGLIEGLANALPELIPMAIDLVMFWVDALIDNLDLIIDAGIEFIFALMDGLLDALPDLLNMGIEIFEKFLGALVRNAPKLLSAGWDFVVKLITGINERSDVLNEKGKEFVNRIENGFRSVIDKIKTAAHDLVQRILDGIKGKFNDLVSRGREIVDKVKSGIIEKVSAAYNWGADLISNFTKGIKNSISKVTSAARNVASKVKSILGFSEPEEGPLSNFHTYAPDMMALFAEGIRKNTHLITDQLEKSFDFGDMLIPTIPTTPISDEVQGVGGTFAPTINVYAAEGQNVREIAEEVMDIMTAQYDRRKAVYA